MAYLLSFMFTSCLSTEAAGPLNAPTWVPPSDAGGGKVPQRQAALSDSGRTSAQNETAVTAEKGRQMLYWVTCS